MPPAHKNSNHQGRMKICLLGAAFDTENLGVGALAVGAVRTILHGHPQAEVFFLNYEKFSTVYSVKFPDRQVAVPLVNMRFSWRFWLRNNIAFLLFLTVLMKLLPFPHSGGDGLPERLPAPSRSVGPGGSHFRRGQF